MDSKPNKDKLEGRQSKTLSCVKLKEVIDHIIMAKKINHTFVPFIEFFFTIWELSSHVDRTNFNLYPCQIINLYVKETIFTFKGSLFNCYAIPIYINLEGSLPHIGTTSVVVVVVVLFEAATYSISTANIRE